MVGSTAWDILVVDDEQDVHSITKLALRNKRWRGRNFKLCNASSGKEAREVIDSGAQFHVALVDVVMETSEAGLEFCEYLRSRSARPLRIILRTGQPGVAPKDDVLTEYDIDFYLEKSDMTSDRLFTVLRSCLRAYQDIATVDTLHHQLQEFAHVLSAPQSADMLGRVADGMQSVVRFLGWKYGANVWFFTDAGDEGSPVCPSAEALLADAEPRRRAVREVNDQSAQELELHPLSERAYVMPVRVLRGSDGRSGLLGKITGMFAGKEKARGWGGLVVEFDEDSPGCDRLSETQRQCLSRDARLFLENWKVAFRTVLIGSLMESAMIGSSPAY